MWLCKSSIGRKVVMAVTGASLILFLLFHASMNVVAIFSESAYNWICQFLGTHWYALAGTMGLAALAVIHIIYAFWLEIQNKKARGNSKYAVTDKPKAVEWSSQNMLVLGIIILLGLGLHLYNFWFHMMFNELVNGEMMAPVSTNGTAWIAYTFSHPAYCAIYLLWLAALWFHLNHGLWSSMQTMGLSGKVWFKRWKNIGLVVTTIIVGMFVAVVVAFGTGLSGKSYKDVNMDNVNKNYKEAVKEAIDAQTQQMKAYGLTDEQINEEIERYVENLVENADKIDIKQFQKSLKEETAAQQQAQQQEEMPYEVIEVPADEASETEE